MLPNCLAALGFSLAALSCAFAAAAPANGASRLARQLLAAGYQYERTIGGPGSAPGKFNGPAGILALPDGTLFVADENNSRIQKLHENGTVLAVFGNGTQGPDPGQWTRPNDVALSPDGSKLFALDSGNQRVKVLSLDGTLQFTFGSLGRGAGGFLLPLGLATGPSGIHVQPRLPASRPLPPTVQLGLATGPSELGLATGPTGVVVTDYFDHSVQKFDFSGGFLWAIGGQGQQDGKFDSPMGCAIALNVRLGRSVVREVLYVADNFNRRVQYFDAASGSYLGQFSGTRVGDIGLPTRLAVTADSSIVVAEFSNNRFQRLSATGAQQLTFGSPGSGPGQFDDPSGVAVLSRPGLEVVYIADHSLHTIQKFTLKLPSPPPKASARPPRPPPPPRRLRPSRSLRRRSLPEGTAAAGGAAR